MNHKKCRLFLWISFILFTLSVISVISSGILSYCEVKTEFPNNEDRRLSDELVAIAFVSIWMTIPCLASELSFIRSICKILKYRPTGYIKICYIISSISAFVAVSFFGLISLT